LGFWPIASVALGLLLLAGGADVLVRGAVRLARAAGIPPVVIGLTVVAIGTSMPELVVSVAAALEGKGALSLGNVVGSNICNVLLILGASALVAPLWVAEEVIRVELPFLLVVSAATWLASLSGRFSRLEGVLFVVGLLGWLWMQIRAARGGKKREKVLQELRAEFGPKAVPESFRLALVEEAGPAGVRPSKAADEVVVQDRPVGREVLSGALWSLLGLVALAAGAQLLVGGAVAVARAFAVSELTIGLTVVAVGTSLPELATSLVAAWRGQGDLAVGNIVGSNLFNLLGVLGISAISAGGVAIPPEALRFDLPVMLFSVVICWPILRSERMVSRAEGAALLVGYGAYTALLFGGGF
jgi:cation:H+ antiporter